MEILKFLMLLVCFSCGKRSKTQTRETCLQIRKARPPQRLVPLTRRRQKKRHWIRPTRIRTKALLECCFKKIIPTFNLSRPLHIIFQFYSFGTSEFCSFLSHFITHSVLNYDFMIVRVAKADVCGNIWYNFTIFSGLYIASQQFTNFVL
jgi:hypothetical protein